MARGQIVVVTNIFLFISTGIPQRGEEIVHNGAYFVLVFPVLIHSLDRNLP